MPPLTAKMRNGGSKLAINLKTAKTLGLQIPENRARRRGDRVAVRLAASAHSRFGTSRRSVAVHHHVSSWGEPDANCPKSFGFLAPVENNICARQRSRLRQASVQRHASQLVPQSQALGCRTAAGATSRCTVVRAGCMHLSGRPAYCSRGLAGDKQGDSERRRCPCDDRWCDGSSRTCARRRRLKGSAQTINRGADIFLADVTGRYLGRIGHYRECHPRVACLAQHCGRREHLNDDLHVVTLSKELLAAPPVDLWPNVVRRLTVPADVEALLLTELERVQ
jgi:hypothetical protein